MATQTARTNEITPAMAAQELLARMSAAEGMVDFIKYMEEPDPASHHLFLIRALEEVVAGACPRLMIFMPPGAAKSTLASVYLPAYFLGKHPEKICLAVSYNTDLAKGFGRRVRKMIGSRMWSNVFGGTIDTSQSAADNWATTLGGQYFARGLLAGITGKRSDLTIIDDPIRGREDADSETIRNKTWEAYKADVRTRLKPGGAIIWMMTRWHEDDPVGRILPDDYAGESGDILGKDGETWRVICIPAIAEKNDVLGREPGDPLWPEWWPPGFFDQERIAQGPRNWASLYQQRPAPDEGNFFLREWLRYYDERPNHLQIYLASDYAVTEGSGDYTVHLVAGVDPNDNIYILDLWRQQATSDVWVESLLDLADRHKPLCGFEEQGQIIKSVGPLINLRIKERRIYYVRRQYTSTADKATRAQAIRGRMASGKIYFPRNANWLADFISELLTFPAGRNDDQVDALSLLGRALAQMVGGKEPKKPDDKPGGTTFIQAVKQIGQSHGGDRGRV